MDKVVKKIALFGGSFNPIHNGHLQIAESLVKQKFVDEVWFIPCGNHAFNKDLAKGDLRLRLINLAIKNNPKLKAVGVELNDNKSYTSKTVAWFKKEFEHQFYFIIGADNLKDLDRWNNVEYLKQNVEFILVTRPGFIFPEKIDIKVAKILELENKTSSTVIRENLKKGISIEEFVPKQVEEYLKQEKVYNA